MKTRKVSRTRGGPVDRVEFALLVADETRSADEVEHDKLIEVVGDHEYYVGVHCKADLVSLALEKKVRREGAWAQKEQMR